MSKDVSKISNKNESSILLEDNFKLSMPFKKENTKPILKKNPKKVMETFYKHIVNIVTNSFFTA